ncbi:MAG TPA: pilus assembly PilX N-terminal domain-containing protein [Candidatus Saccharimonadales bacterium]|nr:pilus assembly PilX N-terminal domain-containing protein [Candidatus Saccharimonadales bacterium]
MKKNQIAVPANENGFASLVIAIVLVLVLSLITVGFAELMRREERSALDKQLSSQAYYAAESGVNAATKAINDGFTGGKSNCAPDSTVPDLANNTVKFTDGRNPTGATYPCLLINPAPPNLHYDPITTVLSRTAQFTAIDSTDAPAAVTSIKISWQDSGSNKNFVSNCNSFKTTSNWPHIGMVRMQLIPITSGSLDRASLTNSAFNAFLCPNSGTLASVGNYGTSISAANNGIILNGNCRVAASPNCSVTITGLPPNQATFFLNLRSLYSSTAVTVSAYNGATPLRIKGAQTLVDSTGKAQDVLRRIQVRVASNNGYAIPDGVHADICKQFDLDPALSTSAAPAGSGCETTSLTY